MNNYLVSVVIPTHNYSRFVTEAVESVLSQTYLEREIIVVDDGSSDETADVLRPYLDRIRYIYQDNLGLSAARNTGILAAYGNLIALLDSDDVWHPRKLEVQVAHLASHPAVGLVASAHLNFINTIPSPDLSTEIIAPRYRLVLDDLVRRSRFGPSGVLARRVCFDRAGMFDVSLRSAEDRDMWIRIARHCVLDYLDAPLWHYRVHTSNMSRNARQMEEYEEKVLRKAFAHGASTRLTRYSLSFAAYSSSHTYMDSSNYWMALHRIIKSVILWPLPYLECDSNTKYARTKKFAAIIQRILHIK